MKIRTMLVLIAAWSVLLPALSSAQDTAGNIARMWVVVPKEGMDDQLEAAMKAHNAWRVENGDPWSWNTYHRVSGDDLNHWYIRSGGHTYADLDAYRDSDFSQRAFEHWSANVDQYVAEYRTHLAEYAPEISHTLPDEGPYEYYWVYDYHIKPGMGRAFYAAAEAISTALVEAQWPDTWWFVWQLDGDSMPAISLVIPNADWAGFAEPAESAYDAITAAKGEAVAKEMWEALFGTVESVSSTVYHRHADLSFEAASD
jgi:hypothetical protein